MSKATFNKRDIVGRLSVRMNGIPVAELRSRRDGKLQLQYLDDWVERAEQGHPAPLSIALPIRQEPYEDDDAAPFFAGLLPDNPSHRKSLGQIFHVSEENDFSLLGAIGRDCAGAISVVPIDAPVVPETEVPVDSDALSEAQLAQLIRDFPTRPLFVDEAETYLISLAGVNDKAAVLVMGGVVHLPKNGYPSSHILKVDIQSLKDSIRVEHFCLKLAGLLGMKVPRARIQMAEDIPYMLVSRYDRVLVNGSAGQRLRRVHQEDFCQALGLPPSSKFEKDGGPGWKECFRLLDVVANRAQARLELLNRALYFYLIANSDGHSKNLSLLHRNGETSLAALYDVSNQRCFVNNFKRLTPHLTMSVGGEHDPTKLTRKHWEIFAEECGFKASDVRRTLRDMAARMPELARTLREEFRGTVADSPRLDLVVEDVTARCAGVPDMLGRKSFAKDPVVVARLTQTSDDNNEDEDDSMAPAGLSL